MLQYRVYNRNTLQFVDGGHISDYSVDLDYLTNNASTITLIDETYANNGDIVAISDGTAKKFLGCISSVDNTKKQISFKHLKEIFNDSVLNVFKFSELLGCKFDAVEVIYEILNLGFITTDDEKRKLPLLLEKYGTAPGAIWTEDNDTINVMEFCQQMFDSQNVYLDFDIDFMENKILCKIIKNTTSGMVIKDNIKLSEPTFDKNELPANNKAIVYNGSSGEIYGTFYLLSDNTVTNDAKHTDRLLPVQTKYIAYNPNDGKTTFTPLEVATSELKGNIYNHCIQYKLSKNQNLVNPLTLNYGDSVIIVYYGREYNSIFTGLKYNMKDPYYTCFFGKTRIDFTDRLKQYVDKKYRKK